LSFIFVDDGSKDGTRDVLNRLRSTQGEQFAVLGLDLNVGKAEAVRQGIQCAFERSPSLVAYLDADLATPLPELEPMRALFFTRPELQAVFGARVALLGHQVVRRPSRHYFGRVFATLASLAVGVTVYDTQCGAKVFRNSAAVSSVFAQRFAARWTFDVEILARLNALAIEGGIAPLQTSAAEWPLASWRDVSGSKVEALDGIKAITELISLGLDYRHGWRRRLAPESRTVASEAERECRSEVRASGQSTGDGYLRQPAADARHGRAEIWRAAAK
jgi:glycosyltransferase involved in cell wall biosynthesis